MSVLMGVLAAWAMAAEGTAPAATFAVDVSVTSVDPSGALRVPEGARVRLERRQEPPMGEMGDAEVIAAWEGQASGGKIRFEAIPMLGPGESDSVVVRWHGIETRAAVETPRDAEASGNKRALVVLYEPTRDVSALTMEVRLSVAPRDGGLQIDHVFELENPRQQAVDTDQGPGLVMPLVAPAPFGDPVASFLPQRPEPREYLSQVDPPDEGRLLIEKGRLVYRGLVRPAGVRVRVVYAVPYDGHTEHTLGFRLPVPASSVTMIARTSERVRPELTLRGPADVLVRPFMDGEQRTSLLAEAPDAGEVVLIDVRETPDRHVLFRPLAAGLGALLVAALLVLALGRRHDGADDAGSRSAERPSSDLGP